MIFRFENRKKNFSANGNNTVSEAVDFIEDTLRDYGCSKKLISKTVLVSEESIALLMEHADAGQSLRVRIRGLFGDAEVLIAMQGREIDQYEKKSASGDLTEMDDVDAQRAIRMILLKAQRDRINISCSGGENRVSILVGEASRFLFRMTVAALILGIIFGLLMEYSFPETVSGMFSNYLLEPVSEMFMSALMIIIAPVIFFSIVSCISQFENIRELGRIGVRVVGMYILTAVIAALIAWGIFNLFHPGSFGFAQSLEEFEVGDELIREVDTSVLNIIKNVIPTNFVRPFLESDSLQIIFLAVILGISVGTIGEHSKMIKEFFDGCSALALTVTNIFMRFIPLAVFCSMALMMRNLGGQSLVSEMSMIGAHLTAIICMIIVYGLFILIFARLNPIPFYRKNREGILTALTLRSSSAAMPINMNICTEKLGVFQRVCSFSIPLGATLYMDGFVVYLVMASLFLARAYGIVIPTAAIPTLILTSILLAMGAPGVPGSGLICLGVLLSSIGVPIGAIGLVMGIDPFLDMFITVSNTTGNVAATLIVAEQEKMLDRKKYFDPLA